MASTIELKAAGLNTSPNQLELVPGSMTVASNIIIKRDNVVESRRGLHLFGNSFGSSSDIAKQLLTYKDLILRHYGTTLQFQVTQDGELFSSFSGSYSEPDTGIRIKGVEANGNYYFTTSDGIKKISSKTQGGLTTASGFITNSGGVKALDNEAYLAVDQGDSSGFLPSDSAVAYRVVWGIKDANDNLILGTPSERAEVYNPLSALTAQDFNELLLQLDNVGASNTGTLSGTTYLNTYKVAYSADGSTLKTQAVALAAALDADILLNSGNPTIEAEVFTGGLTARVKVDTTVAATIAVGDHIALSGFTAVGLTQLNGRFFTVTAIAVAGADFDLSLSLYPTSPVLTVQANTADVGGVINSYNYRYITVTGSTNYPTSLVDTTIDTPATHDQLATIQDTIERFIARLQVELTGVIDAAAKTAYIDELAITTTANVFLEFTIPDDVTTSHFYQVYRSSTVEATGTTVLTDLTPSDDMQLVFEGFPTSDELTAQKVIVEDVTPDQFRGAPLYTNATSEGILQANDIPPFAKDINRFKNFTFYANTRTRHRLALNMLGVQQLIDAYDAGVTPVLTISNAASSESFKFVTGIQEETDIEVLAAAGIAAGEYFTLNSANDTRQYYFWYRKSGVGTDPEVAGLTGVVIDILSADADTVVATKTRDAINSINVDFSATAATDTVSVVNVDEGPCTDATAGDTGFTVTVTQDGQGEDDSTNSVLLSQLASVARAVDATARSLVRVINRSSSAVYAYYLSGSTDVPGKMILESRVLGTTSNPFYVSANDTATGSSFNPVLSPESQVDAGLTILDDDPSSGLATFEVTGHGLVSGDQIILSGTYNASPTVDVDGIYTITRIDNDSFYVTMTLPSDLTVLANSIGITYLPEAEVSNNEVKPNRVYYSKLQQPEAVPILNFLDVGAEDKAILRIVPLRDSLFVFKQDGLYRISGESAPFTLALFDASCILVAGDSIGILNNVIYGWTKAGIENITESGVRTISRPIDIDILPKSSAKYPDFATATWGLGYQSDNSYLVATVTDPEDEVATIVYRFSNLTGSWTTFDLGLNCGIIGPDDKLYAGPTDVNYIEQERKNFDRTDYADREYEKSLVSDSVTDAILQFNDVADFEEGDVITQTQLLTIYEFNALLEKLDIDPGVGDDDYFATLAIEPGDNLRDALAALAAKLDSDPGCAFTDYQDRITSGAGPYSLSITSVDTSNPALVTTAADHSLYSIASGGRFINIVDTDTSPTTVGEFEITRVNATQFTIPVNTLTVTDGVGTFTRLEQTFDDIKVCYNILITRLNADTGVTFTNYAENDTESVQEVVITAVNRVTKRVTVSSALPFVVGPLTLYKKIASQFVYGPQHMGDPLGFKQVREATVMFQNKAFTSATVSFSTDLLPAFIDVDFTADSSGIFGMGGFFGQGFFGGASNSAPFRTYVPGPCQRCRYIVMKFEHAVAREQYAIYGSTLTAETNLSVRAYK